VDFVDPLCSTKGVLCASLEHLFLLFCARSKRAHIFTELLLDLTKIVCTPNKQIEAFGKLLVGICTRACRWCSQTGHVGSRRDTTTPRIPGLDDITVLSGVTLSCDIDDSIFAPTIFGEPNSTRRDRAPPPHKKQKRRSEVLAINPRSPNNPFGYFCGATCPNGISRNKAADIFTQARQADKLLHALIPIGGICHLIYDYFQDTYMLSVPRAVYGSRASRKFTSDMIDLLKFGVWGFRTFEEHEYARLGIKGKIHDCPQHQSFEASRLLHRTKQEDKNKQAEARQASADDSVDRWFWSSRVPVNSKVKEKLRYQNTVFV